MVGDRRMGRLGTVMLPIKAIDTVQPFWLVIDLVFHPFSLRQYRSGSATPTARLVAAAAATIMDPFTFRLLLQCGAMLGWFACLGGGQQWGRQHRFGLTNEQ
jgi:hypothetical protein